MVVRKTTKFKSKFTQRRMKMYRVNRKKSKRVVINAYAPHMGILEKKPEEMEIFYKDLSGLLKKTL